MTWSLLSTIQLTFDWQYTEPTEGNFFKVKHTEAPGGGFYAIALCDIESNGNLSIGDTQVLQVDRGVNDVVRLPKGAYTQRRIAVKKFRLQPSLEEEIRRLFLRNFLIPEQEVLNYIKRNNWRIDIEVSDYIDPVNNPTNPSNTAKILTYNSDGDANGVCFWLGTNEGKQAWANPHTAGKLICLLSSTFDSSDLPANLVDRQPNQRPATQNLANSWMGLDLGSTRKLKCNYYSLRGRDFSSDHLRNWQLQGSDDLNTWVTLDAQSNNTTINQNTWFSSAINNQVGYRYLRVLQVGPSSANSNVMTLGEFEFYGELITI